MNATFTTASGPATILPDTWPLSSTLNLVALYDGLMGGIRLREALEWLNHSHGHLMRVSQRSWSFDALTRLDVRAAAVHEAADADVLVIAADGERRLPAQVAQWIDRCFRENGRSPAVLVALHDDGFSDEGTGSTLTGELRQISYRWGMEFVRNEEFDERLGRDGIDRIFSVPQPAQHARLPAGFEFPARHTGVWLGGLED